MNIHQVCLPLALSALSSLAFAQQAQMLGGSGWSNCSTTYDFNNNNATPNDGPQLGSGTGSDGDYMTWTDTNGDQIRVLKSACTKEQWDTWKGLDGKKIEIIIDDGVVTDVHADV